MNRFSFLESIFLLLVGGYLIYLRISGGLVYYIRPDYYFFTFAMGLALFFAGILNILLFFTDNRRTRTKWSFSVLDIFRLLCISTIIVMGIFVPKHGLSSQTALRRATGGSFAGQTRTGNAHTLTILTSSPLTGKSISNNYTIVDWVGLFQIDPEPGHYDGKSVDVVGFVQPEADGTFRVTRFVISCCIADATPVGFLVDRKLVDLKTDDWIHVKGIFRVKESDMGRRIVIEPETIEKVSQPADPYLY